MQTIALDFRHENADGLAACGSDTVTFLDGRWNRTSEVVHIHNKLNELRKFRGKYNNMLFVGYTILGKNISHSNYKADVPMNDPNPPAWAKA